MTDLEYYKLKSSIFEIILKEHEATAALERLNQSKLSLLQAAGLDPAKTYRFDDATLSVVESVNV